MNKRKITVIEQAQRILGNRLQVDKLSFILDGKRVNTIDVLREAGIQIREGN